MPLVLPTMIFLLACVVPSGMLAACFESERILTNAPRGYESPCTRSNLGLPQTHDFSSVVGCISGTFNGRISPCRKSRGQRTQNMFAYETQQYFSIHRNQFRDFSCSLHFLKTHHQSQYRPTIRDDVRQFGSPRKLALGMRSLNLRCRNRFWLPSETQGLVCMCPAKADSDQHFDSTMPKFTEAQVIALPLPVVAECVHKGIQCALRPGYNSGCFWCRS